MTHALAGRDGGVRGKDAGRVRIRRIRAQPRTQNRALQRGPDGSCSFCGRLLGRRGRARAVQVGFRRCDAGDQSASRAGKPLRSCAGRGDRGELVPRLERPQLGAVRPKRDAALDRHRGARLRHDPDVRFRRLPVSEEFLCFLVRDRACDDHILALLPVHRGRDLVLGGQL